MLCESAMQKLDYGLDQSTISGSNRLLAMPPASDAECALVRPSADSAQYAHAPIQSAQSSRRLTDIICALILLVMLAPLLMIIAVLVAVTSPGPVIFAHRRLGMNGKTFPCLKFRTMRPDAERVLAALLASDPQLRAEWNNGYKLAKDPRITTIGRFLRATSLDELPQLFNVLRGDMTLVGPRPIVREELTFYGRYALHYFSVRPGLTGLWQVSGRSMTTYRRRVAADVYYVRSRSLRLDTWILLGTVPAVLSTEGSY